MTQNKFHLNDNASALYEQHKVPAIFEPLAVATLDHVTLSTRDRILDVACGTGIVARKICEKTGAVSHIVGIDLNESMIKVAETAAEISSKNCEWHTADVTSIPFADDMFTIAFCQQGFQFFSDKRKALCEISRVLKPKGRIAFTVWSEPGKLFSVLQNSVRQHINEEAASHAQVSFSFGDKSKIYKLFSDTLFEDINIKTLAINRTLAASREAIYNELMGSPLGAVVKKEGEEVLNLIVDDTVSLLSEYSDGSNFIIPQPTHLIRAKTAG